MTTFGIGYNFDTFSNATLLDIAEYCDIFNASEEHADNENVNSTTRTRSAAGIKPHKHNIEIINFEDMKHSIDVRMYCTVYRTTL